MTSRLWSGNQRGDTIVEVLLAIVVVASVLGGAFVVSNTSSRNVRKSQERSEALQILQGQMEQFRAFAEKSNTENESTINGKCINNAGAITDVANCGFGTDNRYKVTLFSGTHAGDTVPTDQIITVKGIVNWDELGGTTGNQELVYRANVDRL